MKLLIIGLILGVSSSIYFCGNEEQDTARQEVQENQKEIRLGNFSVSLNVKDIEVSIDFYKKLGFTKIGGNPKQHWIIMQNETATIGLFQGLFEKNSLTFNPGWDRNSKALEDFDDVRELQKELIGRGISIDKKVDETTDGPTFFVMTDPDGNPLLIDQHVARKKK